MTNKTTDRPTGDLLAKLQAAWRCPESAKTRSAVRGAVESNRRRGDVAGSQNGATLPSDDPPPRPTVEAVVCRLHLPPFDGIETPDLRRGGWVRMTCRQCGKFLGYAPR
jgi:hypothetical protein